MSFLVGTGVGMRYLGGKAPIPAFAPSDLANLELWLKPSGLPASGAIATWTDESGNGRDATQATGTAQPTVAAAALNGHDAASFDGSNDSLECPDFNLAQPNTVCIVVDTTNAAANDHLISSTGAGQNTIWRNSTNQALFAGATLSGGMMGVGWRYYVAIFDGATSVLRRDGSQVAAGNAGTQSFTGARLARDQAGSAYAQILIAEVLVYSDEKSGADLTSLESYLADKYAL